MRPLQFYYNDGDAERVRQFDQLRCRVVSAVLEQVGDVVLIELPAQFRASAPPVLEALKKNGTKSHELRYLPPDIELARQLKVRAPLELLVLQTARQLIDAGEYPVACLVEHEVSPRGDLTVYERSLPLYNLPGAQLGLTICSRKNIQQTINSATFTAIPQYLRADIERYYFGRAVRSLYSELLHCAKHSFDSSVTISAEQLAEVTVEVSPEGGGWLLRDGRSELELQPDVLTQAAALKTDAPFYFKELSPQAQQLLCDLMAQEQLSVIYFSSDIVLSPDLFDVTRELWPNRWPLFRRLGLTGDVRAARRVSERARRR